MPEALETFTLRPYQERAVRSTIRAVQEKKNPLIVMPTGAGKSLVIAELCRLLEGQILVITPRIRLLEQNAALIPGSGIMSGQLGRDDGKHHRVVCGTYQTLIRETIVDPDFVLIDEAHLVPEDDSEYALYLNSLRQRNKNVIFIGLTATPWRGRKKIYDTANVGQWKKVAEVALLTLIQEGYLVPPRSYNTRAHVERDHSSQAVITREILTVASSKVATLNRQRALVFCRNIKHAECATQALRDLGETVSIVHSEQDTELNDKNITDFVNGPDRQWLVNVGMLTTGVDLPCVDAIVILRRIQNASLYVQIIGRGLRIAPGKDSCAILDYGKNDRFGYIDALNLDGGEKSLQGYGNSLTRPEFGRKTCPICELDSHSACSVCPGCGHEFPSKNSLDILSSDTPLLSIDIRQSKLSHIITKSEGAYDKLEYHLENSEKAIRYVNRESHKPKDTKGSLVLYRASGGVNRVISVH